MATGEKKTTDLDVSTAMAESDFFVSNIGVITEQTPVAVARARLNVGDQTFSGDVVATSFGGDGSALTNVSAAGVGGSSSTGSLSMIANSAGGSPSAIHAFINNGTTFGSFEANGDFIVNTNGIFHDRSAGFTSFGTLTSANRVGVSGGLAVGAGYVGTVSPTNGMIIEGNLGVGVEIPIQKLHVDGNAKLKQISLLSEIDTNVAASGGTLDITVPGGDYTGLLFVTNTVVANGNLRTQATFALSGRLAVNFSTTTLKTANGSTGGASFTVTLVSANVIRVTNTFNQNTFLTVGFLGI